MKWNEELHPRDHDGTFTHASVGAWASKISDEMGRRAAAKARNLPHGHAEAKARSQYLWSVPDMPGRTERTDAEQHELDSLEHAFETFRQSLGLRRHKYSSVEYRDEQGNRFNEYGEQLNKPGGYSQAPSMMTRNTRMERRRGDLRGGAAHADREVRQRGRAPRTGFPGYRARSDALEGAALERAKVFVAAMRRLQPRVRQEQPKDTVRRTPRGTKVENWMMG